MQAQKNIKEVEKAIENLLLKITKLDIQDLNISEYNRVYFKRYIDNYSFYMSLYSQLLTKALKKLNKPITESTFIDYGGGSGMLSYLAKEIGFKYVVYNDIYHQSIIDVQKISKKLKIKIDYFICGDSEPFVNDVKLHNIKPDLICSFDVLEHIYDLENWFKNIAEINCEYSLLFMTSANSANPFIVNRLKKLQIKNEQVGTDKTFGWKDIDLNSSYKNEREKIIRMGFPELHENAIKQLALKTRGLRKDDIEKTVRQFIVNPKIDYQIIHPTNTCDPYTGNWVEHLIDLKQLKTLIEKNKLTVDFTNSFYAYNKNKILNVLKYFLNHLIRLSKPHYLLFSPTYTIEVQKLRTE